MNKRRRYKAKRRRIVQVWQNRFDRCSNAIERRRALLWLRAYVGLVWP